MSLDILFLDYQSTTPVLPEVQRAMGPYLQTLFANPSSREHLLGEMVSESFERLRSEVALALGVSEREILFTSGATESANMAIFGLLQNIVSSTRKKILVSPFEHACVIEPLKELERRGVVSIEWMRHRDGVHDTAQLLGSLDEETAAVVLMSVNNEIGTVHRDPGLFAELKRKEICFIVDYSQAPGKIDLLNATTGRLDCDVGIFSGHKMYAPKGIGALYVSSHLAPLLKPLMFGGGQQRGLRPGTIPLPLIAGFTQALKICTASSAIWSENVIQLRDIILECFKNAGVQFTLNGPALASRVPNNLNIWFHNVPSSVIMTEFPALAVSTGSACANHKTTYSHVLSALKLPEDRIAESLRFGLSHCVRPAELQKVIAQLAQVVLRLQQKSQGVNRPAVGQ